MAKKTGFRNGDLFCYNCGCSHPLNLPQSISMSTAIMSQFDRLHKNCAPTWTEPINETPLEKTVAQNANWWALHGEQGSSSKTMFNHFVVGTDVRPLELDRPCAPSDPDDFKRCYKLLQAVPQWKQRLFELKTISPVWSALVDNWDKLTAMYEQNVAENWANYKQIGMYELMKEVGC